MLKVESKADGVAWMREALHGLCQPLAALECRLYLGVMGEGDRRPTVEEMRQTIVESHAECERLMAHIRAMQERIHSSDRCS